MLKLSLVVLVVLFADVNYATSNTACDMCNITELMITPSYNITVPAGSTLSLTCSTQVSDSENCSMCLTWKHNNGDVTPAVTFNLSNGNLSSTLSVNGMVTNQGIWSCQTMGTASESAKSIYIKVINVAITGNYTNIRIGSKVNITCAFPMLPSDATIKWISQNGSVVSNTGVLTLSGNHTINNTLLTCSIDSTHTSSQKGILVTVQNTTVSQVSTNNESVVVLIGTLNVKLNCSIELSNQIGPDFSSLLVTWKHNGTIQTNPSLSPQMTGNPGYNDKFNSTLTLSSVDYSNSGNYCCSASLVGSVSSSMSNCVFLTVSEIRISGDYSNLTVGNTTEIICDVPGLMPSVVSWTSSWSRATFTSNTLMLSSVDSTLDGVNFTCTVSSNQLYTPGEKMITVTVKDTIISMVAIEPNNIVALSTGRTHANIICTVTLNSDIGPNYSALSVSWMNNLPDDSEVQPLTGAAKDKFNRTLAIPLTNSGQTKYCCNGLLVGNATTVSACSTVEILDIQISNNFKNLTLGSSTTITCSVPNLAISSIRWLSQDEQMVLNNSGVLVLKTVNYTIDGKTFRCSVNSSQLYSPGRKSITVTVQDTSVSAVTIDEDGVAALKGTKNINLLCSITLSAPIGPVHSDLNVTWKHNGSKLAAANVVGNGTKTSSTFTSTLLLPEVEFSNSGNYCCVASVIGSGTGDQMDCITLNVLDIVISGDFTDLTVGSTNYLICSVPGIGAGGNDSDISWRRTDTSQMTSPLSTNDTLILQSVDSMLNGSVFTCSVSSSRLYSSGERNILLTVKDTSVSLVTIEPKSTSVLIDLSEVLLMCTITLSQAIGPDHQALSVNWTHKSTQLVDPSDQHQLMTSLSIKKTLKRSFTIRGVVQSSQGSYCCHARITGSSEMSNCSSVSVLEIKITGVFEDLRLGNTSSVICSVPSLKKNGSTIIWLSQDGSSVSNTGVLYLNGNCTINKRLFTCFVNSTQLYSSGSKNITVTVKNAYIGMVSISETNMIVPIGTQTHILSCTITLSSAIGPGHSALNVTWQHNNQPVSHDRVHVSPAQDVSNVFYSNLTLEQVSEHDGGVYHCAASLTGNETAIADHVELDVLTNGTIMISGNYTNVRIGSTIKLQCKAPMLTNSTIIWLSQDRSVVNNSSVLMIKPVNYSINRNVFICSVNSLQLTNIIDRTITVTIEEATVSSVTIANPPSYVVDGDQSVELQCTVTLSHHIGPDYSALSITWAHSTNTVYNCPRPQPHGNTQISNTFTCNLTLATVSATSAGVYTCSGEVTGSNILSSDFHSLKVEGSLQSANLHTPKNTVLGQSSVLTCEVHTSLPVTTSLLSVQWMHRGNMVTTTGSGFVLKQGSASVYVTELTLNETTVKQSGLYSCNVSLDTDRQQLSAEGNLTVSFSHVDILITPSNGSPTRPLLGTSTRLNCSVTLHPQLNPSILTIQYQWSSNGEQRGNGSELVLSDLSPANATNYSCQVMVLSADTGQAVIRQISNESAYTLVINISSPSVQRSPSETRKILYIGEDVSITCTSNVTGVIFTWRAINALNQQPVVISNITTHPTPHSSVFKPTVVDYTIVDVFCSVTIPGNDNVAAGESFSFIQLFAPVWSMSVSSSASTVLDISDYNFLTVMCGATFYPSYIPSVSFTFMLTKNSEPVTNIIGPVMSPTPGTISQITSVNQTASSGPETLVYNCTVVFSINGSHITTDSSTTQVTVKGSSLPAAPVVHQPPVTSPTSALIQWSVPEVTYSPEQYTVYYTTNSSSCPDSDEGYNKSVTVYGLNHTEFYTIRDQQYNVTLNNLHPHTVYCYKVVVNNTVERNESVIRTFLTNESAPSGPPQNFNITTFSRSLTLSWNPPLPLQRNGVIISYYINCSLKGIGIKFNETRNSNVSNNVNVSNLIPGSEYICSVIASTVKGDGPATVMTVKTKEEKPGSSPYVFMVKYVSSNMSTFQWKAPKEPNGIITSYRLECADGVSVFNQTINGSHTTTTLSGLHPYTNYSCSITAHTSVGGGPAASTNVITEEDVPSGSPQNFSISTSSRALNIFWAPLIPSQRNGIIVNYLINCSLRGSIINTTTTSSHSLHLTITGLEPFTNYTCSVSAATIVGVGHAAVIHTMTNEDIPETSAANYSLTSQNSTSVAINWAPPVKPNGVIIEYQLQCFGGEHEYRWTVRGSQTTTTLSGLLPYTNYSCNITAHTSVGGGPTVISTVTTDEDVPSKVRDVLVRSSIHSSTTLIVTWQPPATPNGVILTYEVNVSTSSSAMYYNSTISNMTITDLKPQVPYYVTVAAYTVKGRGPYSDTVINFTMEGVPPVGPAVINITRLNGGSIEVVWKPLSLEEAGGFITGYTVTAQQAQFNIDLRQSIALTVPPTKNRAILVGLDPKLSYWVSVSAGTTAGVSKTNRPMMSAASDNIYVYLVLGGSAGVGGVLTLLCICALLCCLCRCCKNQKQKKKVDLIQPYYWIDQPTVDSSPELVEMKAVYEDVVSPDEDDSSCHLIPLGRFPEHVHSLHLELDCGFEEQFYDIASIPKGSFEIATREENVSKNRFENIFSYDHCCVLLTPIDGEPGSNYINATWIDGFKKTRAYIATQGPMDNTIGDFWRMVWEFRLPSIVMLTNLVEKNVLKCSCYWPEEVEQEIDCENGISVQLNEEHVFAEYKIKKLTVTNDLDENSDPLLVTHYHFTQWPDHGVPASKVCLISFIKRVRKSHPPEGPSLLVHCSAGVGRTGTFIVLDTMLQRMKAEDNLNIFHFVSQLRKRRTIMVQNLAQFMYIHDALSEYIMCGDTSFTLMNAHEKIKELSETQDGRTGFEKQFELLQQLTQTPVNFSTSEAQEHARKNRYDYNLPYDHTRVVLNSGVTDYVNASKVNGYKHCNAFLAAQSPLEDTVTDFWQMVWETQSRVIVMLCNIEEDGKETCHQYWPSNVGGTQFFGTIAVKLIDSEVRKKHAIIIRTLEVIKEGDYINAGDNKHVVTQIHYSQWPEHSAPTCGDTVLQLNDTILKAAMSESDKPITVMCNDGVGRTGAFICIYSQLERVKMEGVADIFQFIKDSRLQRKGLARHQDHYIFCYEVIAKFSDTMGLYDNFRNVV